VVCLGKGYPAIKLFCQKKKIQLKDKEVTKEEKAV